MSYKKINKKPINNLIHFKINPIAKLLRTPLFKSRVKPSAKVYNRKKTK